MKAPAFEELSIFSAAPQSKYDFSIALKRLSVVRQPGTRKFQSVTTERNFRRRQHGNFCL
jgi:hypothetical protein